MSRWRRGDQRGTALIEVTWLSILLLVPLVYIVLAVFEVQRAAFAVDAAARAAARAYSLAPSQGEAAARSRQVAAVALADQGLPLAAGVLDVGCRPSPGACLTSGSVIEARLVYPVPLPLVPQALGGNTPSIRVEAEHQVPYGTFRESRP